jgi:hypothetical protein
MTDKSQELRDVKVRELTEELLMSTDELAVVLLAAILVVFSFWKTLGLN